MKQDQVARIFVLLLAFVTVLTGQIVVVPLMAILSAFAAGVIKSRVKIPQSDWFGLLVVLFPSMFLIRWVLPHRVDPVEWMLPAWVVLTLTEYFLLTSVLELFRYRERGELPVHFPAWGFGVLICNHHYIAADLRRYFLLSALACVCLAVVFFQLNRAEQTRHPLGYRRRSKGQSYLLGMLLVLASMLAWQSYEVFARTPNSVLNWILDQQGQNERPIPYENTGRLDAITIAHRSRSEEIALRAFSKSEPGYLRGQAYDVFAEGHWRRADYGVNSRVIRPIVQMAADGPKPLRDYVAAGRYRSGERAFNLETETAITTAKPPWRVIEIRNDSRRGRRYFTPLGASYAQGVSPGRLTVDSNGIIQMGLSTESRYRIYVGEGGKVRLTASHAQMLTSTPPSSQSQFIRRRAQQIAGDQATAVDKINAIEDYCQANYQLSAASPVIPIPKKNDRLSYFLLNEPPATCEYFASAAVVLLREVGVPSRYVTGFVVSDRGRAQDYWEARNRNAHAWVEAYDDLAQQWITVEPTPGMRRNKGRRGGRGNRQRKIQNEKQTASEFKIAPVERQTVYRRFQDFIGSLLGLPAILLLVGTSAIVVLLGRRYRNAPPTEQMWLAQVERQLKRHKFVRRRGETLHQFAGRIKIYPYGYQQEPPLSDLADWLKRYALFRYSVLPYGLERPPKRS